MGDEVNHFKLRICHCALAITMICIIALTLSHLNSLPTLDRPTYLGKSDKEWEQAILGCSSDDSISGRIQRLFGISVAGHPDTGMLVNNCDPDALPVLIELLRSDNSQVIHTVTFALAIRGRYAKKAVPALLHAQTSEDAYLRSSAAAALWHIDPEAAKLTSINESFAGWGFSWPKWVCDHK